MKKLYALALTAFALTSFSAVQAQNFVYSPVQYLEHEVVSTTFEIVDIYMTAANPEDLTLAWELTDETFPTGWTYSLCDYTGCYPSGTMSATMTPLTIADMQAGTQAFLKLNLTTGDNYGNGILEFYVYDENDHSRGDTVTFDITLTEPVIGVAENTAMFTQIGPNPVVEQLNVKVGSEAVTVTVFDITGKVLATESYAANGNNTIDFSAYPAGVYLVRSLTASGNVATERIVKK